MSLLSRLIRRLRDYQRERRIDAYWRLSERAFKRGKERRGVMFARLMRVEINARSDEQVERLRVASAIKATDRALNELRAAARARRG